MALIETLLAVYPHALEEEASTGYLPIHYVAQNQSGEHAHAMMSVLVAAYPLGAAA